jgi:PKD repeat protein
MNNTNTDFIHFNVFDFTGSPSLTSFTLPNTPLTFVVNISSLQGYTNDQILWSFGDNTYSTSLTGVHVYEKPGVYTATCWLYDFDGNSYISIYSTDIVIRDFIVDHVCFTVDSNITLTSGRVDTPIVIE